MPQAPTRRTTLAVAASLLGLLAGGSALAQEWPNRTVRVVVGFAPGGAADYVARVIGDPLAKAVWSFADLSRERPVAKLSTRERQIVMHLGEGRTSKEIARLIDISPRTVETYRAKLLKKFSAGNVAELLSHLGGMPEG